MEQQLPTSPVERLKQLYFTHKSLFFVVGGILIIFVVLSLATLFSPSSTTNKNNQPSIQPTQVNLAPLKIQSVQPADGETNVSIVPDIKITFSRTPTEEEKNNISISLTSGDQLSLAWNNNIVEGLVKNSLTPSQLYTMKVTYPQGQKLSSFTIKDQSSISTEDQLREQTVADKNFADAQKKTLDTYPWLNQLPFQTPDYFVYFDTQQKQFIADLYPKTDLTESVDDQVASMKQEITNKIKNLGANATQYQVSWTVSPEQSSSGEE